MSDTLAALEAALRQSPDDPALLDAVTDYFLDHDDPRGQYLPLSRRIESDGNALTELDWHRLRDQAARLLYRHRDDWLGPLRFLGERVTVTQFHHCWPTAAMATDVYPDLLAALLASPLLVRLNVTPAGDRPGDEGVERLLVSGLVGRLTDLSLNNFGVTDFGAELLAADPGVRQLRGLSLWGNHISPIGTDALIRGVGLSALTLGSQNLLPGRLLPPAEEL
jgi:hypothetical protein